MAVLIAYATIEGQTGKIAHFVEEEIRKAGQEARLLDVSDETLAVSFEGVDKVILAAPVHERRHPMAFEVFMTGQRRELEARPTLLLSISLSAAFLDEMEEAQVYVDELKSHTGVTPDREVLVAGALRTASYDYFNSQILRHGVMSRHEYDPSEGEHEFTDWDALSATVQGFVSGAT